MKTVQAMTIEFNEELEMCKKTQTETKWKIQELH